MFTDMVLNSGNLPFAYTKPYKTLRKAVEETNGSKIAENPTFMKNIFELKDFSEVKAKMELLGVDCSNWLRAVQELRTVILSGRHSYEMEAAVKKLRGEEPFDK